MSVESLAEYSRDARHCTPESLLHDCLARLEAGGKWEGVDKLMVIALDDRGDAYHTSSMQSGMKYSEVVSLLEVCKTAWLEMLLHPED